MAAGTSVAAYFPARIAAVDTLGKAELTVMTGKKAEVRVAFNVLVENGMIKPGQVLTDARRRHSAIVRADGTVASGGADGKNRSATQAR